MEANRRAMAELCQGGGVDEALGEEGLVVGGFDLGGSDQAVDAGGRL